MINVILYPHYSPVDTIVIKAPTTAALLEAVADHARGGDMGNADGLMVSVYDGYTFMCQASDGTWTIGNQDDDGNFEDDSFAGATFAEALDYFLQVVKREINKPA